MQGVRVGGAAARTTSVPPRLIVPPMTAAPGRLGTGAASPVSMASSACDCPAITSPSTGSRAPGSTCPRAAGHWYSYPMLTLSMVLYQHVRTAGHCL